MTAHDPASPSVVPESTPTANGAESGISGVLAAHGLIYEPRCYPAFECECGWHGAIGDDGGPGDGTRDNADAWRAHVAEHLVAIVREHTERALAEVERRIDQSDVRTDSAERWGIITALHIVRDFRAARQEQDR